MENQFKRLFATLSKAEIGRFEQYLRSPYYNARPELLEALFLEAADNFSPQRTELSKAASKWAKASDVKKRLLRSDLLAKLEAFLGQERAEQAGDFRRHLVLKNCLVDRRQTIRYRINDRKSDKLLSQINEGSQKSRLAYELQAERLATKLKERSLAGEDVRDLQHLLERSFILESLRLACDGLSAKAIEQQKINRGLLPVLVQYLQSESAFSADALVPIYLNTYLTLLDSTNDVVFYQLQNRLENLGDIDAREARDIILLAINACIRRINSGRPEGERYAFQLYNLGLEKGYLLDNGQLSRFTFNNIVALVLKTGDKQRAEDFVDRYAKLLPAAYAQSTEALNRARLAFEFGRLEEAMEYLRSAKDQEVLTTLNIRILQMRVYYELSEFRLLDAHLDALDIYLRRRKDKLGYRYKIYRNLVGYVRRFRRLNPYDKTALAAFRSDIKAEDQLPERAWLLRVID